MTPLVHRIGRALAGAQPLRRLRLDRVVLIGAAAAAIVLVLVQTPLAVAAGAPLGAAFGLSAAMAAAVPAALRRPVVASIVAAAAALGLQALTSGTATAWPWSPVLVVTQCLVLAAAAIRVAAPTALVLWIAAVSSSAVTAAVLRPAAAARTSVDLVVFGAVAAAVVVVVMLLAQWRRVRVQLLQERQVAAEETAARLVAEERTRIARELHDVVAHSLSIITVQASTARFRNVGIDERSSVEFDRIAAQSRQALDEMRGLLRVLRGADETGMLQPQPGLADIQALVDQVSATGTRIDLVVPDAAWTAGIGAVTGLTAFRIVQEATSNALRHAPGAPISVHLDRRDGRVEVEVLNGTGPAPVARPPASPHPPGHGLTGMRERAESLGGTIEMGEAASGGFTVRALLPVGPLLP